MNRVFVGFPHGVMLFPGALVAASQASRFDIMARATGNSVLCHNFNTLFCDALNHRAKFGITHFAMCHYDVRPEPFWVDALLALMEEHKADILSVVLAIKDDRLLSSTGIGSFLTGSVRRLTMHELHQMPETFEIEPNNCDYLAVNTGLWIGRIDSGWADEFPGFETHTGISRDADGKAKAWFRPEDWLMSRWAAGRGLRVFATRAVAAWHSGFKEYGNDAPCDVVVPWLFDHENLNEDSNGSSGVVCPGYDPGGERE